MTGARENGVVEVGDALEGQLLRRLERVLDVPPCARLRLLEQGALEGLLAHVDAGLEQSLAVYARPRRMRADERVTHVQEHDFRGDNRLIGHGAESTECVALSRGRPEYRPFRPAEQRRLR